MPTFRYCRGGQWLRPANAVGRGDVAVCPCHLAGTGEGGMKIRPDSESRLPARQFAHSPHSPYTTLYRFEAYLPPCIPRSSLVVMVEPSFICEKQSGEASAANSASEERRQPYIIFTQQQQKPLTRPGKSCIILINIFSHSCSYLHRRTSPHDATPFSSQ